MTKCWFPWTPESVVVIFGPVVDCLGLKAFPLVQEFLTCGLRPLWGRCWGVHMSDVLHIRTFAWLFIKVAKLQTQSSSGIFLWLGVTATWGIVLTGHNMRKVENRCPNGCMYGYTHIHELNVPFQHIFSSEHPVKALKWFDLISNETWKWWRTICCHLLKRRRSCLRAMKSTLDNPEGECIWCCAAHAPLQHALFLDVGKQPTSLKTLLLIQ